MTYKFCVLLRTFVLCFGPLCLALGHCALLRKFRDGFFLRLRSRQVSIALGLRLRSSRRVSGPCWPCASSGSLLALHFFFGPTAGLALLQAHCWFCASSGPLLVLRFSGPLLALRFFWALLVLHFFWPTAGLALLLAHCWLCAPTGLFATFGAEAVLSSLRFSALRLFSPLCDFRP